MEREWHLRQCGEGRQGGGWGGRRGGRWRGRRDGIVLEEVRERMRQGSQRRWSFLGSFFVLYQLQSRPCPMLVDLLCIIKQNLKKTALKLRKRRRKQEE